MCLVLLRFCAQESFWQAWGTLLDAKDRTQVDLQGKHPPCCIDILVPRLYPILFLNLVLICWVDLSEWDVHESLVMSAHFLSS